MSGSKHTPGPWATDIEVETFDGAILDCVVYQNHGSGKGNEICCFRHDPGDGLNVRDAETIANARLIAAAPDLLQACKLGLRAMRALGWDQATTTGLANDWKAANSAIAKAEGRES